MGLLPLTPGLLASAMLRYDHGVFITSPMLNIHEEPSLQIGYIASVMEQIAGMYAMAKYGLQPNPQVLEEFTGIGFYRPGIEQEYVVMLNKLEGLETLAKTLIAWCEACPYVMATTPGIVNAR